MKYSMLLLKLVFWLSHIVAIVLCTMVILSLLGCKQPMDLLEIPLFQTEKVVFTLPEYPVETHPELKGWLICSFFEDEIKTIKLDSSAKSVQLELPKKTYIPLLCYPLSDGIDFYTSLKSENFFHPAGCIYPTSKEITWSEGFVAEVLYQLLCKRESETDRFLSLFNWRKLTDLINEKNINPWQLDKELIIKNISSGNFASRFVKAKKISSKQIMLPVNKNNLMENSQYLYPRYIPMQPLPVEQKDEVFFATVELTTSTNPYILNEENFFLWQGKILKLPS